jgi:hypothetical protein
MPQTSRTTPPPDGLGKLDVASIRAPQEKRPGWLRRLWEYLGQLDADELLRRHNSGARQL